MQKTVGVVVPSYNDLFFLKRLIESFHYAIPGLPYYVTIVDDHSDDGTAEWIVNNLDGYANLIRPEGKSFFTRSANFGIDYTLRAYPDIEYIFLLNSDITVTDYWASGMVGTALRHDAGVVGATLLNPDGTIQHVGAYGPGQHMDINKPQTRFYDGYDPPWVTGAAMMIRRDVLGDIGLIPIIKDQVVQYDASDREFCRRVLMGGYNIAVSSTALYHFTHQAESYRREMGQYENPGMWRIDR
jgi:GT2 family glycosyltransferase